jgi:hypothetical protein
VLLGCSGFDARDEASADPHARGTVGEGGGEATTIGNTTCSHDNDIFACQRASVTLAEVDDCRDEDREWGVTGVATAFATLGTNDIDA